MDAVAALSDNNRQYQNRWACIGSHEGS